MLFKVEYGNYWKRKSYIRSVYKSSIWHYSLFLIQLSRVMPPGYEELAAPNVKPTISLQTGEPPGQITRTVNQSPKTIFRTVTGSPPTQPPPLIPQQRFAPQPGQAPYPPNVVYTTQPAPPPQVFYEHPPPRAPPQYPYPPPPQPLLQQAPPPHVQYVPQVVTAPYPPSTGQPFIAPPPQTAAPPPGGPPYPVESNIQITRTIEQQVILGLCPLDPL